jgi:hypothetical protein
MLKTKILSIALLLLAASLFGGAARADTPPPASLSISSSAYSPEATFSVTVFESSPTQPVNVVSADLQYDPSQLEFVSIDSTASAFGGSFKATGGQGKVSIIRYVTPLGQTLTGNSAVSTITFKALPGVVASTINFAPSSAVYSSGANIWDGQNNSGTYSFTTPAPAAPASTTPAASVPVPKQQPPKTTTVPLASPPPQSNQAIQSLSTAKHIANIPKSPPPPASRSTSILIAGGLIAASLLALHFNAHKKAAYHARRITRASAHHIRHKKLAAQARRHAQTNY